ncbi:hypothetical protein CJ030_MR7G008122 [Morella rubra]|uniref:Uncharacterized protein n=1 Tax=Morella rubra TaxID=262757 RepID=A0A6A1V2M5_9ROSI|nr:hypothetical protein CJ030_MR7G008122 [Morella rubra]
MEHKKSDGGKNEIEKILILYAGYWVGRIERNKTRFGEEKKADEELVDPKKYLEESCKPKCVKPLLEYQCVDAIRSMILAMALKKRVGA